jgi:hypothetical protein
VHYTPKHGSWLNQAEIEISLFSRQCLGRQRIPSLERLQQQAKAWNRQMNRDGVTINWQFTRRKARKKFGYNRNKSHAHRPRAPYIPSRLCSKFPRTLVCSISHSNLG